MWGPHVPDACLDFEPAGRRDGKPHTSFTEPVALQVGTLSGEVAQPHWSLFSRRRRGMVITLGDRTYLYRVTGISSPCSSARTVHRWPVWEVFWGPTR